jgi:formate dehydrogenase iron-sulfur subunit
VRLWKGPLKWLGNLAMMGGLIGVSMHYLRFGPKHVPDKGSNAEGGRA